jgi:hypothetical protein
MWLMTQVSLGITTLRETRTDRITKQSKQKLACYQRGAGRLGRSDGYYLDGLLDSKHIRIGVWEIESDDRVKGAQPL